MSIFIHPIEALEDNYIWAIVEGDKAVLVDIGEAAPALDFLAKNKLKLHAIWITHDHADHIAGIARVLSDYPDAKLYAHKAHNLSQILTHGVAPIWVGEGDEFALFDNADNAKVKVWHSFGHTDSHISYLVHIIDEPIRVFCADTLFLGGCGRVFTGTIEQLHGSFKRFAALPQNTHFYPAHEYTISNLQFAKRVEPSNDAIDTLLLSAKNLQKNNIPTLPTTLAQEQQINPFMRVITGEGRFVEIGEGLSLFAKLRELKNNS